MLYLQKQIMHALAVTLHQFITHFGFNELGIIPSLQDFVILDLCIVIVPKYALLGMRFVVYAFTDFFKALDRRSMRCCLMLHLSPSIDKFCHTRELHISLDLQMCCQIYLEGHQQVTSNTSVISRNTSHVFRVILPMPAQKDVVSLPVNA